MNVKENPVMATYFLAYFDSLPKWRFEHPDHIKHLAAYVIAAEQEQFNTQFKKMLVRTIACAIGNIPNKYCFILRGGQGIGKSSFLKFLYPPQLRVNCLESFDSKVLFKYDRLAICNHLFINFDGITNRSIKSLNTQLYYGLPKFFALSLVNKTVPRTASFIGSSNDPVFLLDLPFKEHFLVFEIQAISHLNGGTNSYYQNINCDLIWAQAYALYKNGFDFTL